MVKAVLPIGGSSRPEVFCKKGVLRNFAKFTGKHLYQSLFFNKVANFIKKETLAQVFSCEFCEICKNTFSYRTPPVATYIQVPFTIFGKFEELKHISETFFCQPESIFSSVILSFYHVLRVTKNS